MNKSRNKSRKKSSPTLSQPIQIVTQKEEKPAGVESAGANVAPTQPVDQGDCDAPPDESPSKGPV